MFDKNLFQALNINVNKFEVRLDQYILPPLQKPTVLPKTLLQNKTKECSHEVDETRTNMKGKESSEILTKKPTLINVLSDLQESGQIIPKMIESASTVRTHTEHLKHSESNIELDEETILEIAILKEIEEKNRVINKYTAFTENQTSEKPKLCLWLFMKQSELEKILLLNSKTKIVKEIEQHLRQEYPRGTGRILIIELLYSVIRFSKKMQLSVDQTGSLLSIFYLAHQNFLRSLHRTPRETFNFFKEFLLAHSLDCSPDHIKLFSYQQSSEIAAFFCTVYLRNISLIRMLALPNFGLILDYEKKPDPFEELFKKKEKSKKK